MEGDQKIEGIKKVNVGERREMGYLKAYFKGPEQEK